MKTSTHKEALEILKPMHGDIEKYMFKPEVRGLIFLYDGYNVIKNKTVDNDKFYIEDIDRNYEWNHYYSDYIPTLKQLWEQVLKFNDEHRNGKIHYDGNENNISMYVNCNELINIKCTDTDSMYLALLKVCVEIWKIQQEVSDE